MKSLIYGFIAGILFGFCLQRGRVLRYDRQLGALRLSDMTIVKFMLTSILVAAMGVHLLQHLGLAQLSVKPAILGANILGGLLFGLGWGLLGYCPGTAVGAVGEGRWDALAGIVGMLSGGALYAEAFPFLQRTVLTWGDLGKLTLPQLLGTSPWLVIGILGAAAVALCLWFEKKNL
jgi:uncharacterized membrane protein YedE/YeeE